MMQQGRGLDPLPPFGYGLLFVVGFYVGFFLEGTQDSAGTEVGPWTFWFAGVGGFMFWLFCIHRFHSILEDLTAKQYPVPPFKAVAYHLIPYFGFWWVLSWTWDFSHFIRSHGPIRILSGFITGPIILLGFIIGLFYDVGIGFVFLFGSGKYFVYVLKKQIGFMIARTRVVDERTKTLKVV